MTLNETLYETLEKQISESVREGKYSASIVFDGNEIEVSWNTKLCEEYGTFEYIDSEDMIEVWVQDDNGDENVEMQNEIGSYIKEMINENY